MGVPGTRDPGIYEKDPKIRQLKCPAWDTVGLSGASLGALIQRGGLPAPAVMVAVKPPAQGMCPLVTRGEADRRASGSRGPTALTTVPLPVLLPHLQLACKLPLPLQPRSSWPQATWGPACKAASFGEDTLPFPPTQAAPAHPRGLRAPCTRHRPCVGNMGSRTGL